MKPLKYYFDNTLCCIYRDASKINSSKKAIDEHKEKHKAFEENKFVSNEERDKAEEELKKAEESARKAIKVLGKIKENGRPIAQEIVNNRFSGSECAPKLNVITVEEEKTQDKYKSKGFLVDDLFPKYSRSDRKLASELLGKIFKIIQESTDKKDGKKLIGKIKKILMT